jgi:hypothetical protein
MRYLANSRVVGIPRQKRVHGTKVQLHLSLPQSIFLTSGGDLHAAFQCQIQTLGFGMNAGTGEAKTPKSRYMGYAESYRASPIGSLSVANQELLTNCFVSCTRDNTRLELSRDNEGWQPACLKRR